MKRYDNIVLNKLLNSYENSAAYAAQRHSKETSVTGDKVLRRRGVFCHIDRRNFPDYYDIASGAYEIIHEQLKELEHKGLIRLYWKGGIQDHILEKAGLETDNVEACYKYLRRTPRWKMELELEEICIRYRAAAERTIGVSGRETESGGACTLISFLDWVMMRMNTGDSISPYAGIDDPAGFERLCRLLLAVLSNDHDVYLRQFSTELFRDSKIAEKELDRAASVIRRFGIGNNVRDGTEDMGTDEIMELYGIYRNPVWLYIKGNAGFRVSGSSGSGAVRLQTLENGLGVTLRDLDMLEPDASNQPECVLTIENLTSYYQQDTVVNGMKALVIYIGGYAGRKEREFLQRLRKEYHDICFMHSGDIDCGGFRIWKSLCEGTGIPFGTYKMDIETYERFLASGRPLTDHDRKTLEKMRDDPFFKNQRRLFDRMLETGIKLEQEAW